MSRIRNRILIVVCLCLCVIPILAAAAVPSAEETVLNDFPLDSLCYSSGSTLISVQQVDDIPYLFLPASADSENLTLNCELGSEEILYVAGSKVPNGVDATNGFDIDSIAEPTDGKYTLEFSLRSVSEDGTVSSLTKTQAVTVMQSANVSAVYLTSGEGYQGKEYVDKSKDNAIEGTMAMVTSSGDTVYDGSLKQIKARGNSTFKYYPKKSYQIKLNKKTSLIDSTKAGKTWVLLAGYADAVKLSDQMWKDVGLAVEVPYTARAERVDLYFDGEYCGSYTLSEKNQLNGNRINITDMEEAYEEYNEGYGTDMQTSSAKNSFGNYYSYTNNLIDPPVRGGFLLEFNDKTGDDECYFKTSLGFAVNVKSPEYVSKDTMIWISEYFQEFEDAIMATDSDGNYTGQNPDTGLYYYDYCDMDSLVQQYMLNCIASNRDAFWHSLFFYMDTDGVMYAGPLWDMELTTGVGWNNSISAQQDWLAENDASGQWSEALIQIPSFRSELKKAYMRTYRTVLDALLGDSTSREKTGLKSIWERAEEYRASAAMDSVLWPDKLMDGSPCALYPNQSYLEYYLSGQKAKYRMWPEGTEYDDIVDARVSWLSKHKSFLDSYFNAMDSDYAATINDYPYDTLSEAFNAAKSGDTVVLAKDTSADMITVFDGVTLDLNGKVLTATYVFAVKGANVIDSQYTGTLKVNPNNIILSANNSMIPVYNAVDGYVFINAMAWDNATGLGVVTDDESDTLTFTFIPLLGGKAATEQNVVVPLLGDGASDNEMSVVVRLDWETDTGTAYQDFVYTDALVANAVNNRGSYALTLTLSNYSKLKNLNIKAMIISNTGAQKSGTNFEYNK